MFSQSYDYSHLIKKGVISGLTVPENPNEEGYKFELDLSTIPTKVKQDDISSVAWHALNAERDSNTIVGFTGTDVKHALGLYADVASSNEKKYDNYRTGTDPNLKGNRLAQTQRTASYIS